MTRIVADASLKARMESLTEIVEVCDESGRSLGFLHPPLAASGPIQSPFSDADIRERLKDRTGRPLADILRDLAAR